MSGKAPWTPVRLNTEQKALAIVQAFDIRPSKMSGYLRMSPEQKRARAEADIDRHGFDGLMTMMRLTRRIHIGLFACLAAATVASLAGILDERFATPTVLLISLAPGTCLIVLCFLAGMYVDANDRVWLRQQEARRRDH